MEERDSNENSDASETECSVHKLAAAIYARQSRVRGIVYSSCESQIDMCRELAASRNWNITQVYSDEGYSSETLDRPQLSQLIAAIEMGEVRRLVVYSLDRLTRRMAHFQHLLNLFERHSVSLAVVNDSSFNDSATGRLMANIIAAANEFQLDLTKERMADMRAAYKRDGKRVAGRVPFGYRTDPATKQLVVDEEQARRVHDFFALAAGGSRPSDLAGLANLQCWPDQKGETGKWTARRILKLLNNRVYIGEIRNGSSTLPGAHQAIISVPVFNEVQNMLASRRRIATKPRKKTDPSSRVSSYLSGKLICGQCNRPMSTSISHHGPIRYIYYRCRSDSGGKPRCPGVNVGAYWLEQFIASAIVNRDDPKSEIPIAMREKWCQLNERQRQKRLPQTILRVVYTHSTGQVTIEIKPEAVAEFKPNETQTDDGNPGLETTN
ncbi:recombinase family protein [Pirellulaceae bacterium SH449]